jgi:hypothetical protein
MQGENACNIPERAKTGINGSACTELSRSGIGLLFEEEPLENNGKECLVNVLNGASPYGSPAAFGALVRHSKTTFSRAMAMLCQVH